MSTAEALREARIENVRAHGAVMEVLENEQFMSGVLSSLVEFQNGYRGKSLKQIKADHRL